MTPTAATAPTRGRFGRMRTLVLTLGIALLGLTLLPPAAGASMNQGDIHSNAMFQIALCEAGGGQAEVTSGRYGDGSLRSIVVICNGGVYGGMYCENSFYGVFCKGAHPHPVPFNPGSQIWQLAEAIPVLESGSLEQITQMLTEIEATNDQGADTGPSVVSPDDQHQAQDTHHSKSKKGKHGKKGGKGRKK